MRTQPYAEAVYQVVPLDGGGFGVKVSITEASPATVSRFDTETAAEAWIASHKSRIRAQSEARTGFRRAKPAASG